MADNEPQETDARVPDSGIPEDSEPHHSTPKLHTPDITELEGSRPEQTKASFTDLLKPSDWLKAVLVVTSPEARIPAWNSRAPTRELEMLTPARDSWVTEREKQVHRRRQNATKVVRDRASTLEREQRDLKKPKESGDKTKQTPLSNRPTVSLMICVLISFLLLALVWQFMDRNGEGQDYHKLGLSHYETGEYEFALEWFLKDLEVQQAKGHKANLVTAHIDVAKTYRLLDKTDLATSHLNTALQMAQQTDDQHGQMEVYFCLGDLQREQLHDPRTSIQYYKQALTLARQLGDRHEEGLTYNRLGMAHDEMGEYQEALEWHQKALKIHQTGDQHGQMRVCFWMGDLQKDQLHSPSTSIQYYDQYLALARQLGDRREEGLAYNRLGLAHSDMGEYEAALEWDKMYLKISEEIGEKKNQIAAHTQVGNAFRLLGKVDQATSHFNTALRMAQQVGDQHGRMDVYFYMGEIQRDKFNSPRTSIQYYEQSLALARQLRDKHWEGAAYNRLGRAHYEMGEYEAALEWLKKELMIRLESGDKAYLLTAHENMAGSYKALGKPDQARSHYQSAMTLAMETGNKEKQDVIAKELASL
ncbi:TTC28 [Branchiostoma lanceolatum]|uniref:TTC28 protein n=1 Tax=Branchiostoma lanceolatum TaxID=7740 RepID=A0A8K0AB90_BRALA|nr:TTC28 [Branchiostoma lanceolatum]